MLTPELPVWRLFRSFAGYGDRECREIVRAARIRYEAGPLPAAFTWASAWVASVVLLAAPISTFDLGRLPFWQGLPALVAWVVIPVLVGELAASLARAAQTYGVLRRLMRLSCCRRCDYPLEGLRITDGPGLEVNPAERRVRCPECGGSWTMLELGLTPLDLLPWGNRLLPANVGQMRRPRRPTRRSV